MSQNPLIEALTRLPLDQRWRGQTHPVATVLAFISRLLGDRAGTPETHYLLIQRQTAPYTGKWGLVGGRWEFGESLATAITREVKEETGIDTTFVSLRAMVNERIAPGEPGVIGGHFVISVCELAIVKGEAQEQQEGPVAWFSPAELADLRAREQIITTDFEILQRIVQGTDELFFIEVEVVAGSGPETKDEIIRFDVLS
jgi:ADP-ribose pyrophosphatase YjhB (NUDIX family)